MTAGFFSWFGNRAEIQRLREDNDYLRRKLADQRELLRLTVEGSLDVEKRMAVAEKDRQEAISSAVHWRTLAAALRTVNADLDAKLSRLQEGQETQAAPVGPSEPSAWCPSPSASWQPAEQTPALRRTRVFNSDGSECRWFPPSGGGQRGVDRRSSTQEQRNVD